MSLFVVTVFLYFFFFKQKTAYEMRISDWSSDVCSSDLRSPPSRLPNPGPMSVLRFDNVSKQYPGGHVALSDVSFDVGAGEMLFVTGHSGAGKSTLLKLIHLSERPSRGAVRSEEHTSELPSLMRISYAVLCLQKQNRLKQICT